MITQQIALKLFDYVDGDLYWKEKPCDNLPAGTKAGTLASRGYMQTMVQGRMYRNHQLVYLMHHGFIPPFIDHIDGNKLNNKIDNLRETDKGKNNYNAMRRKDNTSGFKGVSLNKRTGKWYGYIMYQRKHIHLGSFKTPEDAYEAVCKARLQYHGEHARLC